MSDCLFIGEDEDPEAFQAMVRLWGKIHDAEVAFERIASGYGVNHTSKWARDAARAAIEALEGPASPHGNSGRTT